MVHGPCQHVDDKQQVPSFAASLLHILPASASRNDLLVLYFGCPAPFTHTTSLAGPSVRNTHTPEPAASLLHILPASASRNDSLVLHFECPAPFTHTTS